MVEQLWSRAVAANRCPPQHAQAPKPQKQAEMAALGFVGPLESFDGKEGVDGSSPSEGSKIPAKRDFW